jgi:hypothetical protein
VTANQDPLALITVDNAQLIEGSGLERCFTLGAVPVGGFFERCQAVDRIVPLMEKTQSIALRTASVVAPWNRCKIGTTVLAFHGIKI